MGLRDLINNTGLLNKLKDIGNNENEDDKSFDFNELKENIEEVGDTIESGKDTFDSIKSSISSFADDLGSLFGKDK